VKGRMASVAMLRLLVGALALSLALVVGLLLRPAWQARGEALAKLAAGEKELADMRQITAAIPATRARLEAQRLVVQAGESGLAKASDDTQIIRLIEELAGPDVSVTTLLAGERVPLQAPQRGAKGGSGSAQPEAEPGGSPYGKLSFRMEAVGMQEALESFLGALEGAVPGLRVEAVQWDSTPGTEGWHLVVSGSLYLIQ